MLCLPVASLFSGFVFQSILYLPSSIEICSWNSNLCHPKDVLSRGYFLRSSVLCSLLVSLHLRWLLFTHFQGPLFSLLSVLRTAGNFAQQFISHPNFRFYLFLQRDQGSKPRSSILHRNLYRIAMLGFQSMGKWIGNVLKLSHSISSRSCWLFFFFFNIKLILGVRSNFWLLKFLWIVTFLRWADFSANSLFFF